MGNLVAEAGSAQDMGRRARQEDALIAQFSPGAGPGVAVLSDGMGGHDDGDLASRVLVSEMFGELFLLAARRRVLTSNAGALFRGALDKANARLKHLIGEGCISRETGGTLVSIAVVDGCLRWLSVGDSPLYLYRNGALRRLNEVHSMQERLERLVAMGQMDAAAAETHPQRHYLTSAVTGAPIPKVDCPDEAVSLQDGDVVVLASDGLNVLDDTQVEGLIKRYRHKTSSHVAEVLLDAVRACNAPEQDNASVVVIKVDQEARKQIGALTAIGRELRHALTGGGAQLGDVGRGLVGLRS